MKCGFSKKCNRYETDKCNNNCYPYVLLHGMSGTLGLWNSRGIPNNYLWNFKDDLNLHDKQVQQRIFNYIDQLEKLVLDKGVGLYLFGGTGTGKTTVATTILNEYTLFRTKKHLHGDKFSHVPCKFLRLAELQNTYNSMYRGSNLTKDVAADKFANSKTSIKELELLVIDDIALRDTTEGFRNELYEIIDYRASNGKATIFTSNVDMDNLVDYVGERIASRVEGMCVPLYINGPDFRKGGLF